jgi:hypothetical protein
MIEKIWAGNSGRGNQREMRPLPTQSLIVVLIVMFLYKPTTSIKTAVYDEIMAEREGFEPSIRANVYTLSRRAP